MKLRRFLFAFLLSLAAFQFCFSQEKSKAVLFEEIETHISCDMGKASIDAFYTELSPNRNSTAFVIIYGEKDNRLKNYNIEQMLKNFVDYRKLDKKRFVFAHGKAEKSIRIQFWLLPQGADKPLFEEANWDYSLPKTSKAFVFYKDYEGSMGACDTYPFNFDELYSKILLNNQNLRGHLVIREKSIEAFRKTEKSILNNLTAIYKVPRTNIKVFFVKTKNFADVEYWLVPQKKK